MFTVLVLVCVLLIIGLMALGYISETNTPKVSNKEIPSTFVGLIKRGCREGINLLNKKAEQEKVTCMQQECAYQQAEVYPFFACVLIDCLAENASRIGLERPSNPTQILCSSKGVISVNIEGTPCICFRYVVQRSSAVHMVNGKITRTYSTDSAADIRKNLERKINAFSAARDFPPVRIIGVQDYHDSSVIISIVRSQ